MLFEKDSFTKNLNQLLHYISRAESLITNGSGNTRAQNEAAKHLEHAPKLLELLYRDISAHKTTWDDSILKNRKGQYDNLINRYKDAQQQLDTLRSQFKFTF